MYKLRLGGFGYRKLLSEKQFLQVQRRARELMKYGTNLESIYVKEQTIMYKTRSSEYDNNSYVYTQRVYIEDASFENIINARNYKDIEKIMLNGGLKVHCNCLAKGTRILTRQGFKNIEDIVPNDEVLSSDGKWHVVAALKQSELKSNWKRVWLRGIERPLVVSTDHKLLWSSYRDFCGCGCGRPLRPSSLKTRLTQCFAMFKRRTVLPKHADRSINDGFERYQMHTLNEYKAGELLCGQRFINEEVINFDKDYARILGYYLAEGYIPKRGTRVQFTLNQNEYDSIAKDICDYFVARGVRTERELKEYKNCKWLIVNVFSKEFQSDCEKYCGKYSLYKCPNTEILQWSTEAKEHFVIGYLLGDGCVSDGKIRFNTISFDLAEMLQAIMNTLGIHTFVRTEKQIKRQFKHDIYTVSCPMNKFYDIYARNKEYFKDKKGEIKQNNSRGQNDVDEFVLYNISSIEDAEPQVGYDVCLFDEPHNYVANGVIVSNCPAFHYWGYKYKAWRMGYGLEKELRRPVIRNPHGRGYVCKHLYFVLQTFPFYAKTLASKFGKYWEDQLKKR